MSKRANHLTTVMVEKGTLKALKHLARKDESYDQLIKELVKLRTMNVPLKDESGIGALDSSPKVAQAIETPKSEYNG
jgi:hypothetical protein